MQYFYSNKSDGKCVEEGIAQLDDLLKQVFLLHPEKAMAKGVDSCTTRYVSDELSVLHILIQSNPQLRSNTFFIDGERQKVEDLVKELQSVYAKLGYNLNCSKEIKKTKVGIPSQQYP